jgi:hypothetical protein
MISYRVYSTPANGNPPEVQKSKHFCTVISSEALLDPVLSVCTNARNPLSVPLGFVDSL